MKHCPPAQPAFLSTRFWTPVCGVTAIVCIALLGAWSASDASFQMAVYKAKLCLHVQNLPSIAPEIEEAMRTLRGNSLGKRVIGLYLLFGLSLTSTILLTALTFKHFTPKRAMACGSIFASWAVLYGTHTALNDWRAQRQITEVFPKFEQMGLALSKHWPTEPGKIPPGFAFFVWPEEYPDILLLRGPYEANPFHEDVGRIITRGKNGIIRFDLAAASDSCVEYHPNGTIPSAYVSGFGSPSPLVALAIPLKDDWYLVRYGSS